MSVTMETGLFCQFSTQGEKFPAIASQLSTGDNNCYSFNIPNMMSPHHPGMSPAQGSLKMEACARSSGIQRMRPMDILYSKKRIDLSFHADYESERKVISIETTLKQILANQISPDQLPLIEVMQVPPKEPQGKTENWVINGNKRLYLYKKLEKYGLLQEIPVHVIPFDPNMYNDRKIFSTLNKGINVGIQLRASEFALDGRLDILCQENRRRGSTDILKLSLQALRS